MTWLLVSLVRLYQRTLGRVIAACSGGHSVCIYEPTCSNYMIQAVEQRGAIRGTLLGLWRICRCHPFARGGSDPVPAAGESAGRRQL